MMAPPLIALALTLFGSQLVACGAKASATGATSGGTVAPADPGAESTPATPLDPAPAAAEPDDDTGGIDAAAAPVAGPAIAPAAPAPPPTPRRMPDPTKTYAFNIDGLPAVGSPKAKVTLVKAYEYMCPYSQKSNATIETLTSTYGKDLRVVYSQRVIHPASATAPSMAVCAAAKQGKFAEMDQLLWERFSARTLDESVPNPAYVRPPPGVRTTTPAYLSCHTQPGGCPKLVAEASALGLEMVAFKADFAACEAEVAAQMAHSTLMGAYGTPSFFINGRFLSGAQSVERFAALIDEELKKATAKIAAGTKAANYYKTWVVAKGEQEAPLAALPAAPAKPSVPRRVADPTKTYAFNIAGLPVVGSPRAKITVVRAYEYMCKYSERTNATIEALKSKYGTNIRFAYSQRVVHPTTATAPSMAACAADKQGKFAEMDEKLWEAFNAGTLSEAFPDPSYTPPPLVAGQTPKAPPMVSCHTQVGGCPKLEGLASAIGLDLAVYQTDFKACEAEVQAQQVHSSLMGAAGTPAFFINGRFLNGAHPVERFIEIIDEELKKANSKIAAGTKVADYYQTWIVGAGEQAAPFATPPPTPTPAPMPMPTPTPTPTP